MSRCRRSGVGGTYVIPKQKSFTGFEKVGIVFLSARSFDLITDRLKKSLA